MRISTSYLSFVLKHNLLNNPDYFPISIMRFKPSWFKEKLSELKELAPSKELLLGYKAGDITEAEYERRYFLEVLRRYRREDIEEMISEEFPQADEREIILFCICGPDKFCHRTLLGDVYGFKELSKDDID